MLEIKISGRGGQGVVVAASTLGLSFFKAGMYPQCYSVYGGERRGAPVVGFLRVDKDKILHKCEIRRPNSLIYVDESLFDAEEVNSHLMPGDSILINTQRPLEQMGDLSRFRVGLVDAAAVSAMVGLGKGIVNSTMLGAYARLIGRPELKHLLDAIVESVPAKARENCLAAERAFEVVKITEGGLK